MIEARSIPMRPVMAFPNPHVKAAPVRRKSHFRGRFSASTVKSIATVVHQHRSEVKEGGCIQLPPPKNPQKAVHTLTAAQFGDDAANIVTMETPKIENCQTSLRPRRSAKSPQKTAPTKRPAYRDAERRV
jgi:hypothetical protein